MKKISIVSPCYNEKENIPELCRRITDVMSAHAEYDYEIILADNASTDGSRDLIRKMCGEDRRLKAIFNAGNFGQIRSPHITRLAISGDAIAMMGMFHEPYPYMRGLVAEIGFRRVEVP